MEGFLRLLLRHGADPAAACACSETPQGLAADAGLAALRPWLHWPGWRLPGRRLAAHDLVAAARQGDAGAVARLLDLGLPVDARDDSGGTALLHAAGHGHLDTVDLLLARGAAVDARARSGNTPLVAAILGGHPDAVARLLAQGAVVDRVLAHGATALLVGAACGALEACQQLLAAGADVGHGDAAGNRARMPPPATPWQRRWRAGTQLLHPEAAGADTTPQPAGLPPCTPGRSRRCWPTSAASTPR